MIDVIIYDDRDECELADEPIPYELEPTELPEFREGLHFAPDDEYGYGV